MIKFIPSFLYLIVKNNVGLLNRIKDVIKIISERSLSENIISTSVIGEISTEAKAYEILVK